MAGVLRGGGQGEDAALASAYANSLRLARAHGLTSVAFPAISTGVYGFPADRAARIAVDTIRRDGAGLNVTLVAYDATAEALLTAALES